MAQGEEGAGTGAAPEPGSEAEPEVRARPDSAAAPVSLPDLAARLHAKAAGGRVLAALIGAPGSGKSHMAEALAAAVQALGRPAAVLPMDGFHYDDAVLEARGLRPRKGAPETFDAEGLAHLLDRLRRNDAAEVAVPLFDRTLEISRAGARIIGREVEVVIVEGNWLLLRRPPWAALAARFDLTARLEVGEPVLRARLTERWVGLGLPEAEIRRKLDALDLPNGRLVAEESRETDYVVANG